MSFEGYHQAMCPNRHLFTVPYDYAGEMPKEAWNCPECGEPAVWTNLVDDTNCEAVDYVELELDQPSEVIERDGKKFRSRDTYKWPPLNSGSWDRYVRQMICERGHYYEVMLSDPTERGNCPICGTHRIRWTNVYDPEEGGRGGKVVIEGLEGVGPVKLNGGQIPADNEGVWHL